MLVMVIESFRNQDAKAVYRRGKAGDSSLTPCRSWAARCKQVMEWTIERSKALFIGRSKALFKRRESG